MIPALLTDSVTSDLERAVHYALLWGLEAVELRSVGGPMDRVPQINERKVRRRLLESELPVVSVVPSLFEGSVAHKAAWLNDLAILEETLQFCRRLECSRLVVSGFAGKATDDALAGEASADALAAATDVLRRAGERAAKMDVTVCVHNAEGGMVPTGAALARLLDAVGSPSVRAAWDPAAALACGEDPADALEALAPRVSLVRCRNVALGGNGWEPRAIDKGAVDWGDQLKRLRQAGFDGPVSLDVAVEPKPRSGLHDASTLIRMMRNVQK